MFYETGCYGRVLLGRLPDGVKLRLEQLPGDWLEYDRIAGAVVVRHIQPTALPCLPTVAGELVRMLSEIPDSLQEAIPGGDLFLHTEDKGQLVRLRVEAGGDLRISWAHPDYSRATRKLYGEDHGPLVDPRVQSLSGCVTLSAEAPTRAGRELEALADSYEGLYPEGELVVSADEARGRVKITMDQLNLDVRLLIERLQKLAKPGSIAGRIEVTSFAAVTPEQHARFVFEGEQVWVARPALWRTGAPAGLTTAA